MCWILQYIPPMSVENMNRLLDKPPTNHVWVQHIIKPWMISAFVQTPTGELQQKIAEWVWYALVVENLQSESQRVVQVYTLKNSEALQSLLNYVISLGEENLETEIRAVIQSGIQDIDSILHDILANTCAIASIEI